MSDYISYGAGLSNCLDYVLNMISAIMEERGIQ